MSKSPLIPLFLVIWVALSISALLWGFNFNWPDFVHVNYGLPLSWATNTLSTFAGPANLWSVSITYLMLDLIFWFGLMIVIVAILLYKIDSFRSKENQLPPDSQSSQ